MTQQQARIFHLLLEKYSGNKFHFRGVILLQQPAITINQ